MSNRLVFRLHVLQRMFERSVTVGDVREKEKDMKCVICKQSETQPGKVTVTLERGNMTLVVKGVTARVCQNCGEAYVDETTSAELLLNAEHALQSGVQVEVREFVAA